MSQSPTAILRVALPVPLRRAFEYLRPPGEDSRFAPGSRVQVPFGKGRMRVGIVLGCSAEPDIERSRLKTAAAVIDDEPLFATSHLRLLQWASGYYQHPIGEVLFGALPVALRGARPARARRACAWRATDAGRALIQGGARLGRKQEVLLQLLLRSERGVREEELQSRHAIGRSTFASLAARGCIERIDAPAAAVAAAAAPETPPLNPAQAEAVRAIASELGRYRAFLLNGITGSGKTEVYLEMIRRVIRAGAQALVLVPEISLTPQLIQRVRSGTEARIAILHSGLPESERLDAWLRSRSGEAGVVLGTRSAVWAPLARPGIFIVDEEHDPSYKQQEGFRYSARDVAIVRAHDAGVPVVLGSATPSLESLQHARDGKYRELRLPQRAGSATPPVIRFIDLRHQRLHGAISAPLLAAIERELTARRQTLLFLNRRGYAPVILCHACGWTASCERCNAALTLHKRAGRLVCHHCARTAPPSTRCAQCGTGDLIEVGHGTERLAETLAARFPQARILRIDRDSTRRKGEMGRMLQTIATGEADILIGTQMLAKGHDFPNVTLVGVVDADRGLFSYDFRAGERMAQLIVQVSGRAGRAAHPGTVLIQTHHPEHPLLKSLVERGYEGFAEVALRERREAQLPPFAHLALLRAEHYRPEPAQGFLEQARRALERGTHGLQLYGPVPAPLEKRAGRFRFQLLAQSGSRAALHKALESRAVEFEDMKSAKKVRWSLDIDPLDLT